MSLPNFIIFGTRKAGTTSLYHHLCQHPEIYMSTLKGSRFFLYDPAEPERGKNLPIRTLEAYAKLFAGADKKRAKAIGEASPTYINSSMAARRIKATLPNVRLIASLRNPVDRTYSRYQAEMRYRRDTDRIPLSVDNIPRWADAGLYFKYLKHYFDIFDPSQIKIIIFEEWKTDPLAMLKDVYRFLEVDENFVPNLKTTYNLGGVPKNRFIASVLKPRKFLIKLKPYVPEAVGSVANRVRNLNMRKAPPLAPELRQHLREFFEEDILALQALTRKDLSIWLEGPMPPRS